MANSNRTASFFSLLFLLCSCSSPTATRAPEVVRSDTIYLRNETLAREAKRIWDDRHPNSYRFVAGSDDPKDYIEPVVLKSVPAKYPAELVATRQAGSVVVEGVVDSSGNVIEVFVVRSNDRRFEASAMEALQEWKFEPRRYKGTAIMCVVSLPIEFDPWN